MYELAFGIGPTDLAIVFVVALLLFGPKKLPDIGRQIGEAMREFRKITDEFTGAAHSVRTEIESAAKPISSTPSIAENTTSSTVESAMRSAPIDQGPHDLLAADPRLADQASSANLERADSAATAVAEPPRITADAPPAEEKGR